MTPKQLWQLFLDKWWLFAIGAVVVVIALYGFCGGSGPDKKAEQIQSNIDQQKGVNAVITNQITNQQQVVNNAANNTNQAIGDLGNSVNRPSNQFNSSGSGDRFCRDFPNDPSCVRPEH